MILLLPSFFNHQNLARANQEDFVGWVNNISQYLRLRLEDHLEKLDWRMIDWLLFLCRCILIHNFSCWQLWASLANVGYEVWRDHNNLSYLNLSQYSRTLECCHWLSQASNLQSPFFIRLSSLDVTFVLVDGFKTIEFWVGLFEFCKIFFTLLFWHFGVDIVTASTNLCYSNMYIKKIRVNMRPIFQIAQLCKLWHFGLFRKSNFIRIIFQSGI